MTATPNRFVGSVTARVLAIAFAFAALWLLARGEGIAYGTRLSIAAGVAAWVCAVHTTRRGYRLWMAFAEVLRETAVRVLFTLLYLLVVPAFRLLLFAKDPLHLRRRRQDSAWMPRSSTPETSTLERMG